MRICWVVYAWVTLSTLKGRGWVGFFQDSETAGERLRCHEGRGAWEGRIHLEKTTAMTKMNSWKQSHNLLLPPMMKRGEESEFMRNEPVHGVEWVYQNLPLAAWGHFHSCGGEPINMPSAYGGTPPRMPCAVLRPHISGKFYRPVRRPSWGCWLNL